MTPTNSNSPIQQPLKLCTAWQKEIEALFKEMTVQATAAVPDKSHIHEAQLNRNSSDCVSQNKKDQSQCSQLSSDINQVRRGETALSEELNSIRLVCFRSHPGCQTSA